MIAKYVHFIEQAMKLNPVFVVGSGLSAGAGIATMGQLADDLAKTVRTERLTPQDVEEWERIKHRLTVRKKGLEEALQDSGEAISPALLREIVQQTWRRISNDEQEFILSISNNDDPTGFVRYFSQLKQSNNDVVHIVTTNYDHLIEWSASSSGWSIWDGFHEGAIGAPLSIGELNERMRKVSGTGKKRVAGKHRHLRIYKPHGSLSWFKYPDGQIKKVQGIGSHLLPMLGKIRITPAIVTPGTGKYLETHKEPYNNVLAEMKHVLDRCSALVFLGFGFNDLHIHGSFDASLRNDSVPKIILARSLSDNAKAMIARRQLRNFVAVQQESGGSQMISDRFDSFSTSEPDHWTFKMLLNQAWGGGKLAGSPQSV